MARSAFFGILLSLFVVVPRLASADEPAAEPAPTPAPAATEAAPAPAATEAAPASTEAAPTPPPSAAPADAPSSDKPAETPEEAKGPAPTMGEDGEPFVRDPDFPDVIDQADDVELDQSAHDPKKFAEVLRKLIGKVREKILPKLEDKIEAKSQKTFTRVAMALVGFSLLGVFLIFLPFVYAKKYPGKMGMLFKYSALAAGTFIVAVNLFACLVLILKVTQGAVANQTNPQIAIVTASLDSLDENAEEVVEMGPEVVKPTLEQISGGDTEDPVPVALLDNVARFAKSAKNLVGPFKSAASFLREVSYLSDYIPTLLTIITILLFILATRPMLKEIILLPARAASGEESAGMNVLRSVFLRIGRELIVTLILAVILLGVTMIAGVALSMAVRPAIEALLDYLFLAMLYIQTPNASGTVLQTTFLACIVFLVLNILIVIVGSALFMGKTHKVLQNVFHDKIPLTDHKKYLLWGPLGLLLIFFLPTGFAYLAQPIIDGPIANAFTKGENTQWTGFMLTGPLVFVIGFLIIFWAARGFRGMNYIRKYPLKPAVAAAAAVALAVGATSAQASPSRPPAAPVSFHPPVSSTAISEAARDFDDGAQTVLVDKKDVPPNPAELLPQPKLTHAGERFALGYLDNHFGIWYRHQVRAPLELFPRTRDGWNQAWAKFVTMEPTHTMI